MTLPTLITLAACSAICTRLLTYRRRGAPFNREHAITAWLLIAGSGSEALEIGLAVLAGNQHPTGWGTALLAAVLAYLIHRARGNVAHIVRITEQC